MASWKKVIVSGSDAELNKLNVSNGITGSLFGLATSASYISGNIFTSNNQALSASYAISSSLAVSASYADVSSIIYATSSNLSLREIEVADYSNDVAVTFVNGRLKFIFGAPVSSSITSFSDNSTYDTNRFNTVTDPYTVTANWANNGYSFLTASIYSGSTLVATTTTPNSTTLAYSVTDAGNRTYRFELTASNPLDNSIYTTSSLRPLTLNKIAPGAPTNTITPNVQLGVVAPNNRIEVGATGSLAVSSATGAANSWTLVNFSGTGSFSSTSQIFFTGTSSPGTGTFIITGSATGSATITITSNALYNSNGLNSPETTSLVTDTDSYTKIRSIRYAATATASFTSDQLQNLALWTGSLGAVELTGSIIRGTVDPNNYQFTVNTTAQYIYIVIDSAYTLTGILNVNNSNSNDLSVFQVSTISGYKVYRSNNFSSTSIVYKLTV